MSFNKAIAHRKERRRPYRGAKAISHECRNHGSCPYCEGSRTYQSRKTKSAADDALRTDKDTTDTL